ncbi:hypothetical protein C2G38_2037411 [Gigaspora rosea]|uniref:Uncharacterized protein n=1 Tax=Gigaspora rosea TaxID=44941 RepID=A0A397V719_9GLOM|nr:hypothetical protein C2G38_2037411 [Gigaspora rosea]
MGAAHENINKDRKEIINMPSQQSVEAGEDQEEDKISKHQSQSERDGNRTTYDTETSRDPMMIRTEKEGIILELTHTEQTLDIEIDVTPTNIPSKERSEQNIPQRLYSNAAKKAKSTESQQTHTRRNREEEMAWAQQVIEGLIQIETKEFDEELWHYGKILEAFENEALMQGFIKYKLTHKPTTHSITTAIALKFKYLDRNFFRTFTRDKKIMPAHQKEFEGIYEQAVLNYKGKHSITVTNREIRYQINRKVRQKIAINFLTNYKMGKNPREIAKVLDYCRGFMKMESELHGDKIWRVINETIQDTLQQLPENPKGIPKKITNILLFNLPLRN